MDVLYTPDSYEYIRVNGFSWLSGDLDRYRLPIYPMLIDIFQLLFENNFDSAICVFQLIISLLSIIAIYLLLTKLINSKSICLIFTIIYGSFYAIAGWDKTLLTESLSISITVFIIFGMVFYIKQNSNRSLVFSLICVTIGSLLRAVFAIYAGIIFAFIILYCIISGDMYDKELKMKSFIGAIIPIIIILGYAFVFMCQYRHFTLSDSGMGQQLYLVIEKGFYQNSSDKELIDVSNKLLTQSQAYENELEQYIFELYENTEYNIESFPTTYLARLYIMNNYDIGRISDFVRESKQNNTRLYTKEIISHVYGKFESYNCLKGNITLIKINKFFYQTIFSFYLTLLQSIFISIVEFLSFAFILLKQRKIEWMRLGLSIFIISTVLLSVFGTNSEFPRTSITALPFMFVALAIWSADIVCRIRNL